MALGAVMMVPLLRPEILPVVFAAPKVEMVMLKKPTPPKVEVKPVVVRAATGVSYVSAAAAVGPAVEAVLGRGLGVPRPGVDVGGPGGVIGWAGDGEWGRVAGRDSGDGGGAWWCGLRARQRCRG